MFLLVGGDDFEGIDILGLYVDINAAEEALKEYRRLCYTRPEAQARDYDEYGIYDLPVGEFNIMNGFVEGYTEVATHRYGKKRHE